MKFNNKTHQHKKEKKNFKTGNIKDNNKKPKKHFHPAKKNKKDLENKEKRKYRSKDRAFPLKKQIKPAIRDSHQKKIQRKKHQKEKEPPLSTIEVQETSIEQESLEKDTVQVDIEIKTDGTEKTEPETSEQKIISDQTELEEKESIEKKVEEGGKTQEKTEPEKKPIIKANIVSVRVDPVNLIIDYTVPEDISVRRGDKVAVETDRGLQIGTVLNDPVEKEIEDGSLKPVHENLTLRYDELMKELRKKEEKAFKLCEKFAKQRRLPMKLIDVDYLVDGSKAIFYFFAEGRIDFRELVKDLARHLRVRIEMRQIGIRDVTKIMGGIGPCGREVCCHSFLRHFDTVSIKMAKSQNLVLNPQKVSGLCGRLMCCLSYEHPIYEEMLKNLPGIGKKVITPFGEGRIKEVNIFKRTLKVELQENMPPVEFNIDQVKVIDTGEEEISPEEELLKELE